MHHEYVKSIVLKLCRQPRTFEYISNNLSGLEPTETIKFLESLEAENVIQHIDDFWVIKKIPISTTLSLYQEEAKHYLQQYMGYFDFLKTPHPLDFEWRNTTKSLNNLITKAIQLTGPNDNILFLGMPTLFATAIERDIPNMVTLIERNEPIVAGLKRLVIEKKRFKILQEDIFTIEPNKIGIQSLVVMDPPWYTPHFKQFMWLAAKSIKIGGTVAISIPPINTRPSIMEERIEWFSYCLKLGLCIETLQPNQLQYSMPFFEFNAFRAAGVTDILPFWRKGDFVIFKKLIDTNEERPALLLNQENWTEINIEGVRLRVKKDPKSVDTTENLKIESIVHGDILPTISSRDERRREANIWTSGNRIFWTNDTYKFLSIYDAAQAGKESLFEASELETVNGFLQMITNLEKKEFNDFIDWLYYEMERETTH
ncbi:hypothetical protein [Pedobacter sp. CFBP9032]|uniref:hypothetical protein n=1 Tax=Pedobacter sp. CFBP9032 TaxID=3096539 RepID=UPI002A699830|nr:hypothetical protein [Pedobacter sp. CFBP9032]MDY0903801.1 hypothetical protein [Pedobacter sp. CFBP9032]